VKKLRPPPPRPVALWAATVVVALHCGAVPVGWLYQMTHFGFNSGVVLFVLTTTPAAAILLGCQAVAVFRRRWAGAFYAAGVVGLTFAVPGCWCFFWSPMALFAGGTPALTYPKPVIAAVLGLWGSAGTATGVVMLWWAVRLYKWRAWRWLPRSPPPAADDE
jgi:hypothetical protein